WSSPLNFHCFEDHVGQEERQLLDLMSTFVGEFNNEFTNGRLSPEKAVEFIDHVIVAILTNFGTGFFDRFARNHKFSNSISRSNVAEPKLRRPIRLNGEVPQTEFR